MTVERLGEEYATVPLAFTAGGSTDNGRLEIVGHGQGSFRIGAVSLMPADNVYGWRADTLARLRELNAPVYRWPGGNFVSGYDWKDGIGDPDRRPPRKNPAWKGIESNDVGIDEFMTLCREIDSRALHRGQHRAGRRRGRRRGARVRQRRAHDQARRGAGRRTATRSRTASSGGASATRCTATGSSGHMPLADYLKKHNRVVDAMRAVDPSIVAGGRGRRGRLEQADADRLASATWAC